MAFDTYNRWYRELTDKRTAYKVQVEKLSQDENEVYTLFQNEIYHLTDMNFLYTQASTVYKQQLVRLVFDARLYYKEKAYRTPWLMPTFSHNKLILKEKNLLYVEKKRENVAIFPSGGAEGSRTPVQT